MRMISTGTALVSGVLLVACSNNDSGSESAGAAAGGGASTAAAAQSGATATATATASGGAGGTSNAASGDTSGLGGGTETAGGRTGSDGSGGSLSQGGSTSVSGGADSCAELDASSKSVPPVLEFVIDMSGSMDDYAYPDDRTKTATKWDEMARILPTAFADLPAEWAAGLSFFNFSMTDSRDCFAGRQAVPIAPLAATQLAAINRAIALQRPNDATPTYAAWKFGRDQLADWPAPTEYQSSPRYVVLITDGIPTINNDGCTGDGGSPISESEYNSFIAKVKSDGSAANIGSFVVGVLGSDNPQRASYDPLFKLSQVAVAGGTEQPSGCQPQTGTPDFYTVDPRGKYCHFDMTANPDFAKGLTDALKSIANQVLSCSYDVPKPSDGRKINPNRVAVTLDDGSGNVKSLKKATDSACVDGDWHYSATDANGEPTRIDLCSKACTDARTVSGKSSLKITFTCYDIG